MKGSQVMGATLAHGTELLQSKDKEPGNLLEFNRWQPFCTSCNISLLLVYKHPATTGFCRLLVC